MNQILEIYNQALVYLTINSSFLNDLGLFHGRMGIVLFFSHYARITQNKYYEDFANYLLEDIYEDIHQDLPINIENGLCGIGWGIEYLIQQGFMEGDTDEILADIDHKVMEIDPQNLSDLSFRRGLKGIAFYVIARLNAKRQTLTLPFDNAYLISLQKALLHVNSAEEDKICEDLRTAFNHVLNGRKITLSLPDYLIHSHLSLDKSFDEILLGLENGLAGWLWDNINSAKAKQKLSTWKEKCIYIIDKESRASRYGIGTYTNQLIKALQTTWYIVQIHVFSDENETLSIYEENGITSINIIGIRTQTYYNKNEIANKYYRNLFFAISSLINSKYNIFHLNIMQCEALATQLKNYFPQSHLVLTIHYTSWSFDLLGNREKLKMILASPENDRIIYTEFETEKRLMHLCDRIIAIAQHSYKDIISLYQVPKEKVTLIPHGLQDNYIPLSKENKTEQRKKYGLSMNEQLLIFAGRIDPIKGIEYLAKTFTLLAKQYPNLRLIIAGDGNLSHLFNLLNPIWSKTICTGFIDKSTLYELFSISDIGILPSLHEEFGYVALEMMMMKLPIIAGKTTGLSELVNDGTSGLLIPLQGENKKSIIASLQEAIIKLLTNRKQRTQFAQKGRDIFLEKYNLPIFQEEMRLFYEKCFIEQMIQQSIHIN